jgi:hypothetical protein
MVPSFAIAVTTNREHLMCDGFSRGETIRLGNFEFIADYFGGLSLYPRRATQVLLSLAQLTAGHQPYDGP